jgi:ABC-type amino acid transport substrate-binding protein
VLPVLLVACGLPRDAEGTLERVRGGTIRVGVADHDGWVHVDDALRVQGCEAELVRGLAAELGAAIEWTPDGESALLEKLRDRELDLVIAGLVDETPWREDVALTRPYLGEHVLALPPGENAWLMAVDRFLVARQTGAACG